MHSAIVAVQMPDRHTHAGREQWAAFLATIASMQENPATKRLAEQVWLIDFQKSPAAFAQLVYGCDLHGLTYGILPLADPPQWLPGGFDPTPI